MAFTRRDEQRHEDGKIPMHSDEAFAMDIQQALG